MKRTPSLAPLVPVEPSPDPEPGASAILSTIGFEQRPLFGVSHLVLITGTAGLLWRALPAAGLLGWWAGMTAVALAGRWLSRVSGAGAGGLGSTWQIRAASGLIGLGWGIGAGIAFPVLPHLEQLMLTGALGGFLALLAISLVADPWAFGLVVGAAGVGATLPLLAGAGTAAAAAGLGVWAGAAAVAGGEVLRAHRSLRGPVEGSGGRLGIRIADEMLASTPGALAIVDDAGRLLDVNPGFGRLFGFDPAEVRGRSLGDVFGVPSTELTELGAARTVVEAHRRGRAGTAHPVLVATGDVMGDGTRLVVYVDLSRVHRERPADGEPADRVLADTVAELELARRAAERQAATSASFLANMSHEIRTPLNGILGMADLMLETDLDYEQRQSIDLVRTSAESLLTILNDILDFSKIEAGGMTLEAIPMDLTPLVDSVVRMLAVRAFEQHLELAYDVQPDVPRRIVADPGRLRQVLTNLVGNAIKFTERGEVVVRVSCPSRDARIARIRFEVTDTGVGIAPDRLDAIFEEYVQTDLSTARRFGGTGLGLAITRRLVRLMGGEIGVTSQTGRGSTFRVTVPVAFEAEHPRSAVRTPVELAGVRTLLVGSSATSRAIVADQLRRAGVSVVEASGIEDAHRLLHGEASDAAVAMIDAHLIDGLDGFGLARWIRRHHPSMRVMMLTAAGQRGDGRRCREEGVAAYLTKPVARSELLEALASVVAGEQPASGVAADAGDDLITRYSIEESRQRLRVLVAEDNPVNQKVAQAMLSRRGHEVDVVVDGPAAIAAAAAGSYHVILMDIDLPMLSGLDAMAAIRNRADAPRVPIVAVTAHALPHQRRSMLAQGFDGYLVKPFRPHELFAAVEGWRIDGEAEPVLSEGRSAVRNPVNWDALLDSMREAGIVEALPAILDVFTQDAPGRVEALRDAVGTRSGPGIEAAAHAFKSAAGTIRAETLARLLHHVEDAGRENRLDDAARLTDKACEEFSRVITFLTDVEVVP